MIGKKVTLETICFRMERISAWISDSGLTEVGLAKYHIRRWLRWKEAENPRLLTGAFCGCFDEVDVENPALKWDSCVFRYDGQDELGDGSGE